MIMQKKKGLLIQTEWVVSREYESNCINILNINQRMIGGSLIYKWVHWPLIRYIFCQWDMPYWGFFNIRDEVDYQMFMDLKTEHPVKYRWFLLLKSIDERITKYLDRNNYINNDIPF